MTQFIPEQFIYPKAFQLKNQCHMLPEINSAARELFFKLKGLDIAKLNISDYSKWYLGEMVTKLTVNLQLRAFTLALAIPQNISTPKNFTLIDYGGGIGLLTLLAKKLGIGRVIYNDIYDVSCRDARTIGEHLHIPADDYVEGDINDVIHFLKNNSMTCHAVASNNVIEHIYGIEPFLEKLHLLSTTDCKVVMTTDANMYNPFKHFYIILQQMRVEFKERPYRWGSKLRDCPKSYLKVRKEIILGHLKNSGKNIEIKEVNELARLTRGMIENDIKKCVDSYLQNGTIPKLLRHPTNTCDPFTGNWAEHLMSPSMLARVLSQTGFQARILSGYYGNQGHPVKDFVCFILNSLINLFPSIKLFFAPYYILYGESISKCGLTEQSQQHVAHTQPFKK